ncbi:unnamed protein product, partial [Polarella glacialis]
LWVKCELLREADAPEYSDMRKKLFGIIIPFELLDSHEVDDEVEFRNRLLGKKMPELRAEEEVSVKEESSKVRMLWVDYDAHGERDKVWREVVCESSSQVYLDFPLEGPPTCLHLIRHIERIGGDPYLWLQIWLRAKKLEESDRVAHEMKVLVDVLYYGGIYDQFNMPALISMEVVCRQLQLIVEVYANPARPSWENARLYASQGSTEEIISPVFKSWAAKRNKEEAEIVSARTRARDLRGSGALASEEVQNRRGPEAGQDGRGARGISILCQFWSFQTITGSRSEKRWFRRGARLRREGREALHNLNWLAGFSEASEASQFPPPDGAQTDALQYVEGLVKSWEPTSAPPAPEAALKRLLKGRTDYSAATDIARASYQSALISMSDDLHSCPQLEGSNRLQTLCSNTTESFDMHSHFGYTMQYTLKPRDYVGCFFVWKSNRTKQRLILDARLPNLRFRDPPGVDLCSAESFSRIEAELDSEIDSLGPACAVLVRRVIMAFGFADVKDCFHRRRWPQWLAEYFCFDAVPAGPVGLGGMIEDGRLRSECDMIYQCAGSSVTGFTWSLFFAQRINEYQVSLTKVLCNATLISDRGACLVFSSERPEPVGYFVYVDNLGVLCQRQDKTQATMDEFDLSFDDLGLDLHDGEVTVGFAATLGCELDINKLQSRCQHDRYWRIKQGINGMLRRGRASGRTIEAVVGHATFCSLTCRRTICVWNVVYKFISSNYDRVARLWPSIVEELRCFAGFIPFLVADWARPWNNLVSASDANDVGYGVSTAKWPRAKVVAIGRVLERSRFRRTLGHNARESALTAAGFERDEDSTSGRCARQLRKMPCWRRGGNCGRTSRRSQQLDCGVNYGNLGSGGLGTGLKRTSSSYEEEQGTSRVICSGAAEAHAASSTVDSAAAGHGAGICDTGGRSEAPPLQAATEAQRRDGHIVRAGGASTTRRKGIDVERERLVRERGRAGRKKRAGIKEAHQVQDLQAFLDDATRARLPLVTDGQTDEAPVKYFKKEYLAGSQAHLGNRVMAAFLDRWSEFGRLGKRKTPRAWRALKGWRRLTPGKNRKVHALPVWAAITWRMIVRRQVRMGIFILVQVSTYARPGELIRLTRNSLIPPTQGVTKYWSLLLSPEEKVERSKTGNSDDSLLFDSPCLQWLGPALHVMKQGPAEENLWGFDFPSVCKTVPELLSGSADPRGALPSQAQWAQHRQGAGIVNAGRNSKARQRTLFQACEDHIEVIALGSAFPELTLPPAIGGQ